MLYMSSFESYLWDDSSYVEKYEMDEDENIALVMMIHMHKNNMSKRSGSVVDREVIGRLMQDDIVD